MTDLADIYRGYIACLNARDWSRLGDFVHEDVMHNGKRLGVEGYRGMLEQDYRNIPDLRFEIELLVCDGARVAARLRFHCTPVGEFLGLRVDGKKVLFHENVFYEFSEGKAVEVWSVIDRQAIEGQL